MKADLITKRYSADDILRAAELVILSRLREKGEAMSSPDDVKTFLRFRLSTQQREHFGVMFLDAQHHVIAFEILFSGTLTQTSVYPREIIKRCLELNAAAIILAHNHPSGYPEPSRADEHLTNSLKSSCDTVDIRVLDHIIVGGTETVSFAERGLI